MTNSLFNLKKIFVVKSCFFLLETFYFSNLEKKKEKLKLKLKLQVDEAVKRINKWNDRDKMVKNIKIEALK